MGQKVNPIGLRLGISKTWNSKWFAEKDYAEQLKQDLDIQSFIKGRLRHAAISRIEVERTPKKMKVNIYTARPGIIIGRKGDEVERLRNELSSKMIRNEVVVNIREIKRPEIDATLIAENIANQLERRIAYRRAIKRAMASAMRMNIAGCKIMVGGRLNGAEISRSEWVREGQVRLHTFKADIDYGVAEAHTTYGVIGVKVWVYRGENFERSRSRRSRRKD
ncbi:MAG: 30S ribosomal protein S3 [Deltaproteobacteria bacterium]|nr:30S ribosomal protein S3 [Deltaproteobacteria bacterium]MBQ31761.1 30S ribosomal protein S3 [Deltaproteobacteria bacterium]MDP7629845.1 30S ribosomal protein S3 [SAR324 cluster bacterium]